MPYKYNRRLEARCISKHGILCTIYPAVITPTVKAIRVTSSAAKLNDVTKTINTMTKEVFVLTLCGLVLFVCKYFVYCIATMFANRNLNMYTKTV